MSRRTNNDNNNELASVIQEDNNNLGGVEREFKSCPRLINNNQPQQLNVKLIGGGAQGFESPSSPTSFGISSDVNWQQFHNFLLQRMTAKTAEDRLRHAKQYVSLLTNDEVISNRDYS